MYIFVFLCTIAREGTRKIGGQQLQCSGIHKSEGKPETNIVYKFWREGGVGE